MPQHDSRLSALQPIIGREGKTIGAIAVYGEGISTLSPWQKHVLEACVGLACVAIESRTVDEHIRYLAHYDGLTSLPNRFLFKEYLEQALVEARKRRQKFAVLFLDLDKFKEVNDRFGHEAGDEVLRQIANRMRACLRHTDKIARMGGDEFYVLIDALHDSRYAADVAQKLLQAASRPVEAAGKMHQLSVSIGISIYPNDGHDTQSLLQKADTAMYRAKEMGKDGFAFFSSAQINGD
jgi:diguanylate cyclase (GGDEF)-like protein